MGKIKVKKQSTFIDMTAMSDVTVLLLTFFMLTATFLPKEPVQVLTPASVSERKISEYNVLTILIDTQGRVFLNLDDDNAKKSVLQLMGQDYGITFNDKQVRSFIEQSHIGVPMSRMSAFLDMPLSAQDEEIKKMGVPTDSTNNQLTRWVKHAREIGGDNMQIAIKSDQTTPYPDVDKVMKILVAMKENRYSLVTTLKKMPEGL
ncbi:MAG: ExbD/TolR family protein [Dysgonomonas sp.]|jgi:biopolymer transport protein ExbD|uniref:ExbD/TolR family protein n=1 Tax=unclassified Dysgonomonas TaxID=2630389 RepID=UPI0025C0F22C|nr:MULTISPECIES: biopolymer transporter ExbD [unclassified Dysgonomonas]MDR1716712.1 biopolymer transporter ExbD [Prevotella sp.]MDR2004852.1 biopolymer transporter ExbD [Prevotella sp.]HMM01469.1 biopolymer transporter ExbD [Dysgonomonas sp.]